MSYDYNNITITGRLTHDPDLKYSVTGKPYVRLSVANNTRGYQGEEIPSFFNVMAWNAKAEVCYKYLKKGAQVLVSGVMQSSDYDNSEGEKVKSWTIHSNCIQFIGGKKGEVKEVQEEEESEEEVTIF